MKRRMCLMVVVFVITAVLAQAQYEMMGMMRGVQYGALGLLVRPEVQKELKLSKSQNDGVRKLQKEQSDETKDMSKEMKSGDPSMIMNITKQMGALNTKYSNKALDLLSPEQHKRYGEIRLQIMGVSAVFEPDIQTALAATDTQKESLASLATDYDSSTIQYLRGARDPGKMKKAKETMNADYAAKVAAILTAEQNAKLKEMEGAPFKDAKKFSM